MKISTKLTLAAIFCVTALECYSQSGLPGFEYYKAKDTLVYNAAWVQYEKDDYRGAIKILRTLGNKYATDAATNRLIGLCHTELAEYEKAITFLNIAISNSPQSYGLFTDRARVRARMKDNIAYAADLAAYVTYFPVDGEYTYDLAIVLHKLERIEEAIACLERFKNKDESLWALLAWFYAELENYDKAIAILEDFLRTAPESQEVLEDLAVYYYNSENPEPGVARADKLIQLNPESGRAYYLRGLLMELSGRDYEAEIDFGIAESKGYKIPVEEETEVE
jgi:tetratricopeptide (TPR) repeat protein